jgi:hypothetical protein
MRFDSPSFRLDVTSMATLDDSYTSTNRNSANIAENTAQEPQQRF